MSAALLTSRGRAVSLTLTLLAASSSGWAQDIPGAANPQGNAASGPWIAYIGQLGTVLHDESTLCGPAGGHPVVAFGTLAAVAGGVVGLAAGGNLRSGLAGAAVSSALAVNAGNRMYKKSMNTPSVAEKAICREISNEYQRLQDTLQNLVREQGAGCGLTEADINSNLAGSMEIVANGCGGPPGVAQENGSWSSIYAVFSGIESDNDRTCARIKPMANRINLRGGVNVAIPQSCDLTGPTEAQSMALLLARMSAAAYEHDAKLIDVKKLGGYVIESFSTQYRNGFSATVFKKGASVVIAYRGTDLPTSVENIETIGTDLVRAGQHLATDSGWVTKETLPLIAKYISYGAREFELVHQRNPGTEIILTGHSLGGAIAQTVGYMAHVESVAFDAPGMADVVDEFETGPLGEHSAAVYEKEMLDVRQELANLDNLNIPGGKLNINFRMLGDQVSRTGTQLGLVCTVYQPYRADLNPLNNNWLKSHAIDLMINQLAASAPVAPGMIEQPTVERALAHSNSPFPQGQSCQMP